MRLNSETINNSKEFFNGKEKVIPMKNIENRNYLYPDGHRMTHQLRWFKGSRDRGLKSDMAA